MAAKGSVEAERRVVTILFSDVKGSTAMAEGLDPEEVLEIMNGAFEVLIEPITRYEGTLARLMGDAIMAFFGAPITHEDDPVRACRAALDILEGARAYADRLARERGVVGFNVRVGINTGLVVVAEVGADLRVEYTAMGDAVNLAARMESIAEPGTILITDSTQKLIDQTFVTESIGPHRVKGKSAPIQTYRLLREREMPEERRTHSGRQSDLVGRTAELERVQSALRSVTKGKGGIVAIIGEAGMGKSRLVQEALRSHLEDITLSQGRTLAYTQGMGYWTSRRILLGLLGIRGNPDKAGLRKALEEDLESLKEEEKSSILPYLALILGAAEGNEEPPQLRNLDATTLQDRILVACREFVRLKAKRGTVVLIWDDLHWLDPSSQLVLEALLPLAEEHAVLFFLLYRLAGERASAFHNRSLQRYGQRYQTISLPPLDATDTTLLLDALLAKTKLPEPLRQEILEKTEGNAFFMEEVVRQVIESGTSLQKESGRDGFWSDSRLSLPDTLRGVIMARIDGLSPVDRRTLQTASVVGRSFQRRVLERTLDESMTSEELTDSLAELQRRGFVQIHSGDNAGSGNHSGEDEYAFIHSMTHQVAHDSLLLTQRRILHARAAKAIEEVTPAEIGELAGALAIHYEIANINDKAFAFHARAAERAKNVFANREAIHHYERALRLAKGRNLKPSLRRDLHEGLADVNSLSARYSSALEHYEAAAKHSRKPLYRATLLRKRGNVNEKSGFYDAAVVCFELALKELKHEMDAAEAARVFTGLGRVYYRRGELDSAIELSTLALELMEEQNDEWGIAQACNNLGVVHCKAGNSARGLEFHQRSLKIWKARGETHGLAATHNNLGWAYHQKGQLKKAIDHYQKSITLCEKGGNLHGLASACDNLSQVFARQGNQTEATVFLRRAVSILTDIGAEGSEVVPELWQQSGSW
jgi:class 3 adenylate cyclase/tetratricopeptide (TPR) repeat protein